MQSIVQWKPDSVVLNVDLLDIQQDMEEDHREVHNARDRGRTETDEDKELPG